LRRYKDLFKHPVLVLILLISSKISSSTLYVKPVRRRLVQMDFYFHQRICQECGVQLKGRRDQKFCSDYCRNQFNNRNYAQKFALQRQINRILLNNQRILAQLLLNEKKRNVLELELHKRGYNFEFHTHQKIAKNGQVYIFCYDFGYLRISDQQLFIVQRNNASFP